jgi:Integrase core domain
MSHKASPWENAACESWMKTLKYEEVYRQEYRDLAEACASIARFIEKVYNQKRLHSALGYVPPVEVRAIPIEAHPVRRIGMPKSRINKWPDGSGAGTIWARYRETLQTTGSYVGRVVIVPREFAPMPQSPRGKHGQWNSDGHQKAFFKASRNLSVRCGVSAQPKPRPEHRLSPMAPDPGLRTRREERALLIVQMSSGRLFLDRVARQCRAHAMRRNGEGTWRDNGMPGSVVVGRQCSGAHTSPFVQCGPGLRGRNSGDASLP